MPEELLEALAPPVEVRLLIVWASIEAPSVAWTLMPAPAEMVAVPVPAATPMVASAMLLTSFRTKTKPMAFDSDADVLSGAAPLPFSVQSAVSV